MATTPSHITMLREISAAGDRERTGALDVEWEGAHATLFFMFGHPSHVVFEAGDGRKLAGEDALGVIVDELPAEFRVAPWRRAMVTDDTLHLSAEDLMGLFTRRTNVESGRADVPPAAAPAPAAEGFAPTAGAAPATAPAPVATGSLSFGMADFPILPLGTVLWTDAAANIANLEAAVPRLPDSLVVLSGSTCRGAALLSGGTVVDAVWVSAAGDGLLGAAAAHAVLSSADGTLTAYRFDHARLLISLRMLWRSPRIHTDLPASWLHTDELVAEVRSAGRTCALVVDADDPGVALFDTGELVAVYTAAESSPATSAAALRSLLNKANARVSVLAQAPEATVEADASAGTAEAAVPVVDETPEAAVAAEAAVPVVDETPEAAVAVEVPVPVVDETPEAAVAAEAAIPVVDETPEAAVAAEVPVPVVDETPEAVSATALFGESADVADAATATAVAEDSPQAEAVASPTPQAVAADDETPAETQSRWPRWRERRRADRSARPGEVTPTADVEAATAADADTTATAEAEAPARDAAVDVAAEHVQATDAAEPVDEVAAAAPVDEPTASEPMDEATAAAETETPAETAETAEIIADTFVAPEAEDDAAGAAGAGTLPASDEFTIATLSANGSGATDPETSAGSAQADHDTHPEPAMFTIASLSTESTPEPTEESTAEPAGMRVVEARAAAEFVPTKLDIDVDALRAELTDIAVVWLGSDDSEPVAKAIRAARPGVDDFVSTIASIGAMEIPGHEAAVVRAMAREMHFRASEVLCGV